MRAMHQIADLVLPRTDMDGWCTEVLRDRHDRPWIVDRRDEVMANVDRLEAVIDRARAIDVPHADTVGRARTAGDCPCPGRSTLDTS